MATEHSTPGYTRTFKLSGMTCRSCELLAQETLAALPGVFEVKANVRKHEVTLRTVGPEEPTLEQLSDALADTQFGIALQTTDSAPTPSTAPAKRPTFSSARIPHWAEILVATAVALLGWFILDRLGFSAPDATAGGAVGLGAIVLVGLVAACSSCLALVGGLLLSVSAQWSKMHPHATGWEKFKPMLAFNAGRLVGYFVLGGLVGLLGQAIGTNGTLTGYFTLAIALVMIVLGLNILHLIPKQYCTIPLPKPLWDRIANLSQTKTTHGAVLLGALTFFLPCGFTQSTQLLALGSGSFLTGGLIMLAFALGTLPTLLGISALSSFLRGSASRYFLIFSGVVVLLLGFQNVQSSLILLGWHVPSFARAEVQTNDPYVSLSPDGRQVITVYVNDNGYTPNSFTIQPGKETWVYAIAEQPVGGCAAFIQSPSHGISSPVVVGGNWLGPIQNPTKDFLLTCSMGMLRADVHVRKS